MKYSKPSATHLKQFIGPYVLILIVISILTGVLLSATEILFSLLLQAFLLSMEVIDTAAVNLPNWIPRDFSKVLILLGGFAFIRGLIQWYKVYSNSMTNESFSTHMRQIIARWAFLNQQADSAQVITLINDRVSNVGNLISSFQGACIHVLSISFILFHLLRGSWLLASCGMIILAVAGTALKGFDKHLRFGGQELYERSSAINDRLLASLRNLKFLKILRAETLEQQRLSTALQESFRNIRAFNAIKSTKFAAPQLVGVFVIILISILNKQYRILSGGAFISFIYLFIRCSQTLSDLSSSVATVRLYTPQFADLYRWYLEHSGSATLPPGATTEKLEKRTAPTFSLLPTRWELSEISFSYGKSKIIDLFSLKTNPGKITAFRGSSGAGKSTLLYIMAGILIPDSGKVLINGKTCEKDLHTGTLSLGEVRFGYVGPDPHIISGTIHENLLYGLDYSPSQDEILKALDKAHCLEFLKDPLEELNKKLSDRGDGLSTGQKQRLSLARALLRKPTALLLDEPTANLDEVSAAKIMDTLVNLKGTVSIILISHHNSILGIADKIVEF